MIPYSLLAMGLVLVFLEFYTPGGILAVAGAGCILTAIVLHALESKTILSLLGFVFVTIISLIAVIRFTLNRIKKSGEKNTFYLSKDQEGYQGALFDVTVIGKEGSAATEMSPSGYVLIEGKRYGATTHGTYIDKGMKIKVIGGEGSQLIVQKIM